MCECKKCPNCGYEHKDFDFILPENFWDNISIRWKVLYHYGDGILILSTVNDLNFKEGKPAPKLAQYTEDVTWVFEIKDIHKLRDKFFKWERPQCNQRN